MRIFFLLPLEKERMCTYNVRGVNNSKKENPPPPHFLILVVKNAQERNLRGVISFGTYA